MLSHKWEDDEPLYQRVVHVSVYDLDQSPTHDELQTFRKIVPDARFQWVWSDACCINKSDHFVLQDALVAMFKRHQSSALVIVFLRGVRSPSHTGALVKSVWNTRAWIFQEYVAAKVVCFYTEDWTPYLDLRVPNHKLPPEMASYRFPAEQLMLPCPGLTSVREKLLLASMRETGLVEDAIYSLLGIFSAVGIPAIYGEGVASQGRLLDILTRSPDVSIQAWTRESGLFDRCRPARIAAFDGSATSHLPPYISDAGMENMINLLDSFSFNPDSAPRLYD